MADHIVRREVLGQRGRYVIGQGAEVAELTCSLTSPGLVTADHTSVPDSFRGTGAGLAMVARLVADARAEGFKIRPLCPFVEAQRLRHPDWADAFAV